MNMYLVLARFRSDDIPIALFGSSDEAFEFVNDCVAADGTLSEYAKTRLEACSELYPCELQDDFVCLTTIEFRNNFPYATHSSPGDSGFPYWQRSKSAVKSSLV
jgi:hypothetical protein